MLECGVCAVSELKPLYRLKSYAPNASEHQRYSLTVRVQHTLFYKYSSSQNYHYTKEVNEILANSRSVANIHFNDYLCLDEEDEYLKRMYQHSEYDGKVHLLSEFYKFHRDLPRWTVSKNILRILNYYYDKKRKLEYYKIQRMIEMENRNNPNMPAKGIVGDHPIESCSTPISESSETLNVNYNVDNILHDITSNQVQASQSLLRAFNEEKSITFPKVYVPPLTLDVSHRRMSTDIQQMVSMLSVNHTMHFEQQEQIKPILTVDTDTPINLKVAHHFSQKKTITKPDGGLFQKKKFMQKKSLKLEELGLSSSRNDERMPQSARYQNSKLMETCLTARSNQGNKQSQTTSRERASNNEISRDLLKQLKIKPQPKKTPTTARNTAFSLKDSKQLKGKESVSGGRQQANPPLSNRSQPKKTFHQMMAPTEIKRLEMKVLQGLQEIQKKTLAQKMCSFDQKSLHQILANYHKNKQTKAGSKPVDSFSQYESQNYSDRQKPISPPLKVKIGKLDLRKLKQFEMFPAAQSARIEQPLSTRASQHNYQKAPLKTDRPLKKQTAPTTPTPNLLTSTTTSRNGIIDRKLQTINNLMQWQIKAIQAASKEYNLYRK